MEKSEILIRSAIEDLKRHQCYIICKTDTWENKIFIYMKYEGHILGEMIESIDTKPLDVINLEAYQKLYAMFESLCKR